MPNGITRLLFQRTDGMSADFCRPDGLQKPQKTELATRISRGYLPPVSRWDAVRHQKAGYTHKRERSEGSEHGTDKSVPYKVCRHSSYKWERGEKREGCALSVAARQLSQRESPWQLPGEYTVFQNILSRAVLSNRLYKTGWPVRNRWRSQTAATGK